MDSEELDYIDLVKSVSNDMQIPDRLTFDSSNSQSGRDIDMQVGYMHADMNLPDKIFVSGNEDIENPSRDFPFKNGESNFLPVPSRPKNLTNSLTDYPNSLMLSQDDLDIYPANPKASFLSFALHNLRKVSKSVTELFNSDIRRLDQRKLSPMTDDLYRLPSNHVDLDMIRNHIKKMDLRFRRLEALEEARTNRDTAILVSMFGFFTLSFLSYLFGGRRRSTDMKKNPPPSKSIVPAKTKSGKQVAKKNNGPFDVDKDGQIIPGEYKLATGTAIVKKIKPAEHYDVLNIARAMNDDFAPKLKELFDPEREACLEALETGFYYSWRPIDKPWDKQDCIRIHSKTARCFCKHMMNEHQNFTGDERILKCLSNGCKCKAFNYVPSRPAEVGEFWLPKRRDFVASAWRIRCRCKHNHEEHEPHPMPYRCRAKGCGCSMFYSASVCAGCDMHWHKHNTVLETEKERKRDGRQVREEWFPFSELPKLCTMAMTGQDTGVQTLQEALPDHLRSPQKALPQGNNDVYHPPGRGPGPSGGMGGGPYR